MNRKKLLIIISITAMVLGLSACGQKRKEAVADTKEPTWAIYIYMCGSDLESGGVTDAQYQDILSGKDTSKTPFEVMGMNATIDLGFIEEGGIPSNLNIIVQTGGALRWNRPEVDPNKSQKFLYNSTESFKLLDEQDIKNMGESETLEEFVTYCLENYSADRQMLILWDHGGGLDGVCYDEIYSNDNLKLDELYEALSNVQKKTGKDKLFDLIGMDACLMAAIDPAYVLSDFADIYLASEEVEHGGYDYTTMLKAMNQNPGISPLNLATVLADSYKIRGDHSDDYNVAQSVIDLKEIDNVVKAYDEMGIAALKKLSEDDGFYAEFSRVARDTLMFGEVETIGGNSIADLGDFCKRIAPSLPEANKVLEAMDKCILHLARGRNKSDATGLTFYCFYNRTAPDLTKFISYGAGSSFKCFYSYGLAKEVNEEGLDYLKSVGFDVSTLPKLKTLSDTDWEGTPIMENEDEEKYILLGEDCKDIVSAVSCEYYWYDAETEEVVRMGSCNNILCDFDTGTFTELNDKSWGFIEGKLICMDYTHTVLSDDLAYFQTPIGIKGEVYLLSILCDFSEFGKQKWYPGDAYLVKGGMPDYSVVSLSKGDRIDLLSDETDPQLSSEEYPGYRIVAKDVELTSDSDFFKYDLLPEGDYFLKFLISDYLGDYTWSGDSEFHIDNIEEKAA